MHQKNQDPDKLDRKLLYHLDLDSRKSIDKIASKLKTSEETLRYRFNRIENTEWVFKYHVIIDTSRLGYTLFKVYFKLQSSSTKTISLILDHLIKLKEVVSLISADGNFDLCVGLLLKNVSELDHFINSFMERFHEYVSRRSICINIRSDYLFRDYLIESKTRKAIESRSYQATAEVYSTDNLDRLILRELSLNSRFNANTILNTIKTKVSKDFPVSRESILYRIRKLEMNKVITGYNIVLNHPRMNQLQYKIFLRLNYFQNEELDAFLKTLKSESSLVYIIKTLGEWDYEIELEVENIDAYRNILMRITEKHPRMIKDYSALLLTKIHIYDVGRRLEAN